MLSKLVETTITYLKQTIRHYGSPQWGTKPETLHTLLNNTPDRPDYTQFWCNIALSFIHLLPLAQVTGRGCAGDASPAPTASQGHMKDRHDMNQGTCHRKTTPTVLSCGDICK